MQFYGIINQENFEKEIEKKFAERIEEENNNYEEYEKYEIDEMVLDIIEELLTEKKIINGGFYNDILNNLEINPELEYSPKFEDFDYKRNIRSKLSENVYNTILMLNIDRIKPTKTIFFERFYNKTFGKKHKKTRKYALKEFKRIFNEVHFSMDFFPYEFGKNIYPMSKIERLYKQKLYITNNMSLKNYLPLLYGKLDLYNTLEYYDRYLVDNILSFHSKADILLQLNSDYDFEKDTLFNKISDYQIIASELGEKFNSEESFVFTMYTINSWFSIKQTELYGLYDFLVQNKMYIGTDSNFLRIVQTEFNLTFDKFKKPQDNKVELKHKENPTIKEFETKHSQRVKKYKKNGNYSFRSTIQNANFLKTTIRNQFSNFGTYIFNFRPYF